MRLAVPLLFAITCQLVLSAPIDHLLRSPQFLLITQYKCGTIFESGTGTSCPQGITPHNRSHVCDIDVWTNLVRDPANLHPPKILYLGSDHTKSLSLVVEDIGFEFPENGGHHIEMREIVFATNTQTMKIGDLTAIHDVTGVIYDSNSQLLYLLLKRWYKNDNLPTVLVFFVRNIFGQTGNVQLEKLAEFPQHQNNGNRLEWGIDASTHTVYYTNTHGEGVGLYSLPVHRLMSVLKEGTGGELVHSFSGNHRSHFRVSGELLFSSLTEKEDDRDVQFAKVRNIRFKEDLGMNCQYRENISHFHNPSVLSTIVVRDDDYCLLRYKKGADLGQCLAERKQWRAENKLSYEYEKTDGDGAWCTVLFVVVLVLAFLLVTSCFCLCWMKRNLDDSYSEDLPRSMPYYAAGRPGQYPEDVSVDRWNNPY